MMNIHRAAKSDVGMKRSNNQDYMGFRDPDDEAGWQQKGSLSIVADGMGGHAGGEVASRIAVDTILQEYVGSDSKDVEPTLVSAVHKANQRIFERAQDDPELRGMGTTCVALVLRDNLAYFAHVGDSRAYLIRDGQISQVTRDHSLVNQLIDRGDITPEEAENHPDKNVITRSLGIKPSLEVDTVESPHEVLPGDAYLLCSDGLSGLVSDEEMLEAVTQYGPDEAAELLIDLANERGGPDNITVQIVTILAEGESIAPPRRGARAAGGGKGKFLLIGAVVVAVGLAGVLLMQRGGDGESSQSAVAVGGPSTTRELIEVRSDPPGALVYVDGKPSGRRTPTRVEASLGVHDFLVEWRGGSRSESRRVDIPLGGLEAPVSFRQATTEPPLDSDTREYEPEVYAGGDTNPEPEGTPEPEVSAPPEDSESGLTGDAVTASVKLIFRPKVHELYVDGKAWSLDSDTNLLIIDLPLGAHTIDAYNRDFDQKISKEIDLTNPSVQETLRFRFKRS